MFKKVATPDIDISEAGTFPHCDQRILHAPGECNYCDNHKDWQALRVAWSIAFTGWEPEMKKHELPCPADHARGNSHKKWQGNVAEEPSHEGRK